jgi:polysaccharide biosynthesis transport protein
MSTGIERPALDLRATLQILRGRWTWVLIPVVLTTALQLGLALRATTMYTSSTDLLLRGKATDAIVSGVQDQNAITTGNYYSDRVLATEIKVIGSDALFRDVKKRLGYEAVVIADGDPQAAILRITAVDHDPEKAAIIANTYAEAYRDFRKSQAVNDIDEATVQLRNQAAEYQTQITQLTTEISDSPADTTAPAVLESLRAKRDAAQRSMDSYQSRIDALTVDAKLKSGSATVLSPAIAAKVPTSPRPVRSAATGLLAGLILGLGLAFLREFLDDRIYGGAQIASLPGSPAVLGSIPRNSIRSPWGLRKTAFGSENGKVPAHSLEAYRSLRSAITFLGAAEPIKVIQITSAVPAEGKSTTVTNLAHVISQSGQRVLVVDADLRRPTLHDTFAVFNDVGLSNVLAGEVGITAAAKTLSDDGDLTILTAGPTPPNAAELLGSWRAKDVFAALRPYFDVILVDGPPLLAVTDPLVVGQFVDAVVLVVRARKSRKKDLTNALELLRRSHRNVAGIVINATPRRRFLGLSSYGYAGPYGYDAYGASAPKKTKRKGPVQTVRTVDAWVPDDSPIWTAPMGEGWTSQNSPVVRSASLSDADDSLSSTSELSAKSPVVRVPNDPRALSSADE